MDDWFKQIKKELSEPLVGVIASVFGILSLVTFFISTDISMKFITIIVFLMIMFIISPIIRLRIKVCIFKIYRWLTQKLTQKFIIVFLVGICVGSALYPIFLQPKIASVLTFIAPKIELLDTYPVNGGALHSTTEAFCIDFKKQIPRPYYNFIEVNISPDTPIKVLWSDDHQSMYIRSTKIFPIQEDGGILNPRFDFDTTYSVQIKGPFLSNPIKLKFSTPSKPSE